MHALDREGAQESSEWARLWLTLPSSPMTQQPASHRYTFDRERSKTDAARAARQTWLRRQVGDSLEMRLAVSHPPQGRWGGATKRRPPGMSPDAVAASEYTSTHAVHARHQEVCTWTSRQGRTSSTRALPWRGPHTRHPRGGRQERERPHRRTAAGSAGISCI